MKMLLREVPYHYPNPITDFEVLVIPWSLPGEEEAMWWGK